MIGLLIDWHADVVDPQAARRFAGALGAGLPRPLVTQHAGSALLAGTSLIARDRSRWRAREIAGGGWLAFTGFIANLAELRHLLDRPGADAADLYAAGLARWGDDIDTRAIGEFASIAVYPNDRRVRAARSPIIAPPLHLWHDDRRAVIASTPRAVLAAADLPAEVDERKVADALYLNYSEGERGWYRHVRRLDNGARTVLEPGTARTASYYDLFRSPDVRLKRDEDYVDAARALLTEGTRAALDGHERPAIALSGGLDSQAVAAAALAERPTQRLVGFTNVPQPGFDFRESPGRFNDERHHVAALAAMYPMLDSRIIDSADVPIDHKLSAMFLMGGVAPRNVLNLSWLHGIYEAARAADCDVLLSGAMGNVGFSFNGGGALPSWAMRGQWRRLAREVSARRGSESFARVTAREVLVPLLPLDWQQRVHRNTRPELPVWCPLRTDYAREMQVADRAEVVGLRAWRSTRQHRAAMLYGGGNEGGDLRQGFAAIHGLRFRDPTAYRPLLEFCAGLPDDQFLRDGQSRWLARRVLRGRIPDMVVDEQRRGHQAADAPLRIARMRPALLAELDSLARDPAMAARFDLPRLRTALEEARGPSVDLTLRLALPRTIAMARFIRYVEGTNG